MSRRHHERANDELADWLAQLGEPPPDEDAAPDPATGPADPPDAPTVPPDPPTVPPDLPTVPPDFPTVPSDLPTVPSQPTTGGHATSAPWPPDPDIPAPHRRGDDQPRSSRRLWLLAALPWLVMAAAALAAWTDVGVTDEPDPGEGPGPDPAAADDDRGVGSPGSTQPQDGDSEPVGMDPGTEPGMFEPGGAGKPPAGELAAAAEAAVRTVGARQLAGVDDTAVHVGYARATETSPLGDGTVVSVAALVRHAADGGWSEPDPLRFAVVLDGEGRLREPPWPLPAAELTTEGPEPAELEPLDVAAADDLVDSAGRALTRAGYDAPDVQALHRVGDRALRVEALARPPGARERGAVVAWLTPDGGRVLGQRAAAPATPDPDERDP